MRDPHEVLGISRGASFDEVKGAYRRACKSKHPDMGGSKEAFVELQAAYESILGDLKRGYQKQDAPQADRPQDRSRWERAYHDIDEELEELRRSTRAHEDALRAMRAQAWQDGNKVAWAKLTWSDFAGFISGLLRSGVKGLAVLLAALIGLGSVLVEANAVSAVIMLGAGLGFVCSHALKSDKGGMLSAGLLLFGIMTIWLPPVRQALIHYPLATVSLLLCLALIFKFGQQGGMVGLLTGGVLTCFVAFAILSQTPQLAPYIQPASAPPDLAPPSAPAIPAARAPVQPEHEPETAQPTYPPRPEVRELTASKGAVLKLVPGVTYRLKARAGFRTTLAAIRGSFASFRGDDRITGCTDAMDIAAPDGPTPYMPIEPALRSCGSDAIVRVTGVQ